MLADATNLRGLILALHTKMGSATLAERRRLSIGPPSSIVFPGCLRPKFAPFTGFAVPPMPAALQHRRIADEDHTHPGASGGVALA